MQRRGVEGELMRLTSAERNLGLEWLAANIVGWVVGFAACEAINSFISTFFVDGLVIGTALGFAQWFVLRRRIPRAGWWVVLSIVGFGVGKALSEAVAPATSSVLNYALGGALIGLSVGLAQWLILRLHVSMAWWWVPASILAWVVGWSFIGLAETSADLPTVAVYLVGAIGAAGAGIITGAALIRLFRSRVA
jgi:hypothetical protein